MAGELHKIISWSFWTANLVGSWPWAAAACTAQHTLHAAAACATALADLQAAAVVVQLVDAVYVIMAWATATNLANASGNLHIETWQGAQSSVRSFVSNNIWRAPIAACALGGLMVVLFNLMSCIVLLRCGYCTYGGTVQAVSSAAAADGAVDTSTKQHKLNGPQHGHVVLAGTKKATAAGGGCQQDVLRLCWHASCVLQEVHRKEGWRWVW